MFCILLYFKKRGCYIFYVIIKTKLITMNFSRPIVTGRPLL